ncbi:hypothetical protein ABZ957_33265 [Streptomyces sp. NPDC046316]|uniref:hypothetical protein n=1 Tax=Streptomyces sp. NPDC046316 TaxID=3154494 RepID=UPI0033EF466C
MLAFLIAALVVGVAGVLTDDGSACEVTGGFSPFGYDVTGSAGTFSLYGIVIGAVALPAARRSSLASTLLMGLGGMPGVRARCAVQEGRLTLDERARLVVAARAEDPKFSWLSAPIAPADPGLSADPGRALVGVG